MNPHSITFQSFPWQRALAAAGILLAMGLLPVRAAEPAGSPNDGAEVLTRGPVHEAFAETITFKPTPGMLVPRAAPALIEELPPDQRPAGANISWIPGYWAWDSEGGSHIWVSGIWRNLPPGRQWMPGYWSEAGQDFQWVSGYWADAAAEEVEYLSEPPESMEAGPNIKAPSRDHSWMPGSWIWRESRYLWRPGYWDVARPDWVWVPSYYVQSPRGYICVDGYYDYSIDRRGMIFAPVRFSGNDYSRPDYYYRPSTVISLTSLVEHLFLRPRQRHYYFGDYYDPEYRQSGYYASYNYYSGGHGYDPIYAHNRWRHREDDRWERRNEENFRYYRDNQDERPPHTLAAFQQFNARTSKDRRVDAGFVTPLARLVASRDRTVELKAVNEDERQKRARHGREIRDFGEQRRKHDTAPHANLDPGKPRKGNKPAANESVRVKIPRSPVAAKVPEQPAPADTPPKRRAATELDDKPFKPGAKPRRDDKPPTADTPPGKKPRMDPKDPPKSDPKAEPVKPRPRESQHKVEPKREPQPEQKVEPKREPQPQQKAEPKHEPKPQQKAEPKHEPKPQQKAEPKGEPKPQSQPKTDPKRESKAKPKRESKGEPADKNKEKPQND